ncbi:MAG: tRNA epoxyqueuosine(34) reductase QueG [Gemmatimonadales bacterium]
MTAKRWTEIVKAKAIELGFDSAGITNLEPVPHRNALRRWLEQGMAGTMGYMHRQARRRMEPKRIVPEALYAVVVTKNYFNPDPPPIEGCGRVAKYARGRDYHDALAAPLAKLAAAITALGDGRTVARYYVDAGPVPERELAQRAGLGWIGKNTMLIDPVRGSYTFLATILTNLSLLPDMPFEADRCGTCRRCLDACPTNAFPEERVLDSRRCISYLTIEHRGDIAEELHEAMGSWIFGCDVCQDVCPWNEKFAVPTDDPGLEIERSRAYEDLDALGNMTDAAFELRFGTTALSRPGAAGLRRNAQVAARNRAIAQSGGR